MKWAAGGWSFFIAENLILSENRTYLIEQLGDDGYHAAYGTLSTLAVGSIGYGYLYRIPKGAPPLLWKGSSAPLPSRVAAWALLSLGMSMASQTLPKLQIPLAFVQSSTEKAGAPVLEGPGAPPENPGQWKVQCPFDFTDNKSSEGVARGLDRISRHPGLWSMALTCAGYGCLFPSLPQKVWWTMPILMAWIGGSHTDSRYRRSMGGTLTPEYDGMTSNIPFLALAQVGGWKDVVSELKPLNALVATSIATIWVIR
jgi:prenyl protein peptidase